MTTLERTRVPAGVTFWLTRIEAEYREMPGLSLTKAQMQRLWALAPETCEVLLETLVTTRVLRRTPADCYVMYD